MNSHDKEVNVSLSGVLSLFDVKYPHYVEWILKSYINHKVNRPENGFTLNDKMMQLQLTWFCTYIIYVEKHTTLVAFLMSFYVVLCV